MQSQHLGLRLVFCVLVFPALAHDLDAQCTFTDVSAEAGFTDNDAGWSAAWADYDRDGRLDVVTLPHELAMNYGATGRLWHNNPDGTFTDVSAVALLDIKGDLHSAGWADFDGDGDADLLIIKGSTKKEPIHYNDLWINRGDGTFHNVAAEAGITGIGHRGRGAYIVDYDGDGDLDIFSTSFHKSLSDGGNLLFRNNGDMTFIDVAVAAGVDRTGVANRSAAWADYDGDHRLDLFLGSPCALYRQREDHTFEDVTAASGISASEECWNMAWGDYDGDGDPDLYVAKAGGISGVLYRNEGDGRFTDGTMESGVINTPAMATGTQGVIWGDYDNDGFLDLYIVNGDDVTPNRLFHNLGDGTFADEGGSAGVTAKVDGKGSDAIFVDYDGDGFLDLFVTNGAGNTIGPNLLFHNNGNENGWLKVSLVPRRSNPGAIGAKLVLTSDGKMQSREYTGQHLLSQDALPVHFGVGQAAKVDSLVVHWPSGTVQTLRDIAVRQHVYVTEEGEEEGGWSTPVTIDNQTGRSRYSKLALDGETGEGIAVWVQAGSVWANHFTREDGWQTPVLLEGNSGNALKPWIAMGGGRDAVVVWMQRVGTQYDLYANRFSPEEGWGEAEIIESEPGTVDFPRVAVDGGGNAIALWKQWNGSFNDIWTNRYTPDSGWGRPVLLEDNSGDASETWVSMNAAGAALAMWRQSDGVALSIWSRLYTPGAGWGPVELAEYNPGIASYPHVALDSSGNGLSVWHQKYPGNPRSVWANLFTPGQGWGEPVLLETNTLTSMSPDMDMDSQGNAVAVWRQTDGTNFTIWANHYKVGTGWVGPVLIGPAASNDATPSVGVCEGSAVAAWVNAGHVLASRYVEGSGWGSPKRIDASPDPAAGPEVDMDLSGNAVVLWMQGSRIWACRYAAE